MTKDQIISAIRSLQLKYSKICCCVKTCLGISSDGDADLVLNQQGSWVSRTGSTDGYAEFTVTSPNASVSITTSPAKAYYNVLTNTSYISGSFEISLLDTGPYQIEIRDNLDFVLPDIDITTPGAIVFDFTSSVDTLTLASYSVSFTDVSKILIDFTPTTVTITPPQTAFVNFLIHFKNA